MGRSILIVTVIIIATAAFFLILSLGSNQGINQPDNASPSPTPTQNSASTDCDALSIVTPTTGSEILSPVIVEVVVDNRDAECNWTVFEAVAGSANIEDSQGNVLGTEILMTSEEWMTEGPTTYTAEINFEAVDEGPVNLVISETNPSGIEEQQSIISIPLVYASN